MYNISSGSIAYLFWRSDIDAIYDDSSLFVSINMTIIEMSWRLGQMLLYYLFLKRLQNSFKNTKYQSPKSLYCLFYLCIIAFILVYIITKIIWILCTFSSDDYCFLSQSVMHHFFLWFLMDIITLILDLGLSISMILLFVRKLWKLTEDLVMSQNESPNKNQCALN